MNDIIESLKEIGLNGYEAKVYVALLKKYPEYVDHKLVIAGSFIRGLESYSQQIRDFIEKNSINVLVNP